MQIIFFLNWTKWIVCQSLILPHDIQVKYTIMSIQPIAINSVCFDWYRLLQLKLLQSTREQNIPLWSFVLYRPNVSTWMRFHMKCIRATCIWCMQVLRITHYQHNDCRYKFEAPNLNIYICFFFRSIFKYDS